MITIHSQTHAHTHMQSTNLNIAEYAKPGKYITLPPPTDPALLHLKCWQIKRFLILMYFFIIFFSCFLFLQIFLFFYHCWVFFFHILFEGFFCSCNLYILWCCNLLWWVVWVSVCVVFVVVVVVKCKNHWAAIENNIICKLL